MIITNEMIWKIRHQSNFKWQEICPYNNYDNSFVAHAHKHPINEQNTGKWNSIIDYHNKKTILDSYFKVSIDLPKKYALDAKYEYVIKYDNEHKSYNILDKKTGLMVCLKFWKYNSRFYIATCYFPSNKVINLFSKSKIEEGKNNFEDFKYIGYIMNINNKVYDVNNTKAFEEAMREFFGIDSIEYKILFNNETHNIDDIINSIIKEITDYLDLMISLIKNEDDKEYYFVYNDGIEYVIKLSLLYKIKDIKIYENLYQKFLKIDINNSYKDALDECKKYIDEGEKDYENKY